MLKLSKKKIMVILAEKHLTVAQAAKKMKMLPNNFSSLLSRGTCQTVTAGKLASILGVSVAEILED